MDIKKAIESININVDNIEDPELRSIVIQLLNIIEAQATTIKQQQEEIQKLRDENNRLKGEQGKPGFRKQTSEHKDFSSEKERNRKNSQNRKGQKPEKKNKILIDRTEVCKIDDVQLPFDAIFKGYQKVVVQDIVIKTDNVEFSREIYYSPSLKMTIIAPLPNGYEGEFGPNIKTLILSLYYKSRMTESAIIDFFKDHKIMIGKGTVSRFLTDDHERFHQEKQDIVYEGLQSTIYQQMDDTGARVNGKNYYAHILCNEFFTAYFTRRHKDRLTIVEILTQGNMQFTFNEATISLMKEMKLSGKTLNMLQESHVAGSKNRQEIDAFLNTLFPDPKKHQTNRRIILEASAIAAYQELPHTIDILLTDDAPQYNQITQQHSLCWIHDGRHYKKIEPVITLHREQLKAFVSAYWDYYDKLLAYKAAPNSSIAEALSHEFDTLFATRTGCDKLDERIEKTKAKKNALLLVLKYPKIPLHNNASELGARDQARRRDISYHTINAKGTASKDTFMTLAQTAKKLMVNFFQYTYDRVSKKYEMPSLASLIASRSKSIVYNTS